MTHTEISANRLAIQHLEAIDGQRYAAAVDLLVDLFYSAHANPPTHLRAHPSTMGAVRHYLSKVPGRWHVRWDWTPDGAGMFMTAIGSIALVDDDSIEPGALRLSIEELKEY